VRKGFAPAGSSLTPALWGRGASVLSYPLTQTDMTNSTDQLRENCRSIVADIERSAASVDAILDDALSIEFTIDQNRTYMGSRILVAFGGPNIWINTRNETVEGSWGRDRIEFRYNDEHGLYDACENLFECLR
jgi:hypothetical protein